MAGVRALSPELAKKAQEELNDNKAGIDDGLKKLKEWLSKQSHFKGQLDDQWLVAFLRGSKFSLEQAKEKLNKFYTIRTLNLELFKNRDPTVSPLKDLIQMGLILPLGNVTDPTGPMNLYIRLSYNPEEYPISALIKYLFMVYDILVYSYDQTNISGLVTICDMAEVSPIYMAQFTPTVNQKTITTYSTGYPNPLGGLHYINVPSGYDSVFSLVKSFMPSADMVFIHPNMESLNKYVPKANLPSECGGNAGNFAELTAKWKSIIEKHKDFLIEGENYYRDDIEPEDLVSSVTDVV